MLYNTFLITGIASQNREKLKRFIFNYYVCYNIMWGIISIIRTHLWKFVKAGSCNRHSILFVITDGARSSHTHIISRHLLTCLTIDRKVFTYAYHCLILCSLSPGPWPGCLCLIMNWNAWLQYSYTGALRWPAAALCMPIQSFTVFCRFLVGYSKWRWASSRWDLCFVAGLWTK